MFEKDKNDTRFEFELKEVVDSFNAVQIITDKETKTQYLIINQGGTGVGITPLLDSSGKSSVSKK